MPRFTSIGIGVDPPRRYVNSPNTRNLRVHRYIVVVVLVKSDIDQFVSTFQDASVSVSASAFNSTSATASEESQSVAEKNSLWNAVSFARWTSPGDASLCRRIGNTAKPPPNLSRRITPPRFIVPPRRPLLSSWQNRLSHPRR